MSSGEGSSGSSSGSGGGGGAGGPGLIWTSGMPMMVMPIGPMVIWLMPCVSVRVPANPALIVIRFRSHRNVLIDFG